MEDIRIATFSELRGVGFAGKAESVAQAPHIVVGRTLSDHIENFPGFLIYHVVVHNGKDSEKSVTPAKSRMEFIVLCLLLKRL